ACTREFRLDVPEARSCFEPCAKPNAGLDSVGSDLVSFPGLDRSGLDEANPLTADRDLGKRALHFGCCPERSARWIHFEGITEQLEAAAKLLSGHARRSREGGGDTTLASRPRPTVRNGVSRRQPESLAHAGHHRSKTMTVSSGMTPERRLPFTSNPSLSARCVREDRSGRA